jgi:hypothetical protein
MLAYTEKSGYIEDRPTTVINFNVNKGETSCLIIV